MSNNPNKQQQNISIDQYASNIKTTVFAMTGALSSKMENIIDELLQQVVKTQEQLLVKDKESESFKREILRLQDILSQNKITFNIPANNGKAKIAAPPPTAK